MQHRQSIKAIKCWETIDNADRRQGLSTAAPATYHHAREDAAPMYRVRRRGARMKKARHLDRGVGLGVTRG